MILDDKTLKVKLFFWSHSEALLKQGDSHLNFLTFNRNVLVTGEVANTELWHYVARAIKQKFPQVKQVFNELQITRSSNVLSRAKDSAISVHIELLFQNQEVFHPTHVQITTENRVVYLMGMVTQREGNKAAKVATKANGVMKVVKLFEYLKSRPKAEIERDKIREARAKQAAERAQRKAELEAEKAKIQDKINQLERSNKSLFF